MRKSVYFPLLFLPALAPALADEAPAEPLRLGVALQAGLGGPGADLALRLNSHVGLRATAAGVGISRNGTYGTSDNWTARLTLFQAGALVDYYPFGGSFRLSAGAVYDGNKLDALATTAGGTYTFNGRTYHTGDLASASGRVRWYKVVPYLGLGSGNLAGAPGMHVGVDAGVLFAGTPTATLSASCTQAAIAASACDPVQLQTDLAGEQAKLRDNTGKLKLWPVLRVEVGYSF